MSTESVTQTDRQIKHLEPFAKHAARAQLATDSPAWHARSCTSRKRIEPFKSATDFV